MSEDGTLTVRPWADRIIDTLGHDPRSSYVERFWLGILGPSTTFLLRHLATILDDSPAGTDLPLRTTARYLGLGGRPGRHSPFMRSFDRLVQFDLARRTAPGVLQVRRKVPPLNRRQLSRLPGELRAAHERWYEGQRATPPVEALRRRSRQLALSLLELGEDLEATERQLMRWRYHPAMCRESAAWAWDRHQAALRAARGGRLPSESHLPAGTPPEIPEKSSKWGQVRGRLDRPEQEERASLPNSLGSTSDTGHIGFE